MARDVARDVVRDKARDVLARELVRELARELVLLQTVSSMSKTEATRSKKAADSKHQ